MYPFVLGQSEGGASVDGALESDAGDGGGGLGKVGDMAEGDGGFWEKRRRQGGDTLVLVGLFDGMMAVVSEGELT